MSSNNGFWFCSKFILIKQMEKLNMDNNLQEAILHCIDKAMAERIIIMHGPFTRYWRPKHVSDGWVCSVGIG
jgi:hypothetical protein